LGEHLRRRRLALGLRQWQVAAQLGITTKTYTSWKWGVSRSATIRCLPGVTRFLGYCPRPAPRTFPERLRFVREGRGLSVQRLALLGTVPSTILAWEKGWRRPGRIGKSAPGDRSLSQYGRRRAVTETHKAQPRPTRGSSRVRRHFRPEPEGWVLERLWRSGFPER